MFGSVLVPALSAIFMQTVTPTDPSVEPSVKPAARDSAAMPTPAPSPVRPADSPGGRSTRWYGAPAVAADAATIGLFYATAAYADSYQGSHRTD